MRPGQGPSPRRSIVNVAACRFDCCHDYTEGELGGAAWVVWQYGGFV
jgi:hypothetical protein